MKCEIPVSVGEFAGVQRTPHVYVRVIAQQKRDRSELGNDPGWVCDNSHIWIHGEESCFMVEGGDTSVCQGLRVKFPDSSGFSHCLVGVRCHVLHLHRDTGL